MTIKRIGILTAGGDCPGLNAVVRAVSKNALRHGIEVLGLKNGFDGLVRNEFIRITDETVSGILTLGGTILGTSNIANPFNYTLPPFGSPETPRDLSSVAMHNFRENQLDALITIGGDGTLHMSQQFVDMGMPIVAVPKTIDNDLFGTDHCPGYGSAAKFIATTCMEIGKDTDVYNTDMVTVVEIMGRHAGWLTASAALATEYGNGCGPDLIYLPEIDFNLDQFTEDVTKIMKQKRNVLVAVSEGLHYSDGSFVSEAEVSGTDGFGHAQLGGLAVKLANYLKERLGLKKVRGIELSLLQRSAAHIASLVDVEEAEAVGKAAVEAAVAGATGQMVALERDDSTGLYSCKPTLLSLNSVANYEKKVPVNWITKDGNYVTNEFINYVLPLIQGEPKNPKEDSLPRFAKLKKVLAK